MAVVELGMNHAGEIRTLVGIARPDIRVWTNVGDAHVGFFGSVDAIADAKAEILEGATADYGARRQRGRRPDCREDVRVRRARRDIWHRTAGHRPRRDDRRSRDCRHGRARRDTAGAGRADDPAARARQPLERPGRDGRRRRVRCAAGRHCGPRVAAPGRAAPWRSDQAVAGHRGDRRQLQRQPGRHAPCARRASHGRDGGPPDRRARRDARTWRPRHGAARSRRARRRGGPARSADCRRRRRGAAPWQARRSRAGLRASAFSTSRRAGWRPTPSRRSSGPAT